ncbi:MAG TPA: phosphoglucosamine mutase [Xanthomonadaceae bacterium]|nr:phosphoglucosamine mutase [Xanthomonadaceae bacterium]
MSERKYFGTDGIRGRVGEWPISADFMLRLGWAVGRVLRRGNGVRVLIGKDTRISGYMFESALEAGLVAAGADVLLLGPMPTPAVAYLTRSLRASAGIVISASHNPHQDNGIKFFSAQGEKLDDAVEGAIEDMLDTPFSTVPSQSLGRARRVNDAAARYVEFCKGTVPDNLNLRGLRVVLDCAHGATYQVAPRLFAELGAGVDAIGVEPDGLNINSGVGSTHIDALVQRVRETGAELGIAFDGDGDRVLMVDAGGALLDGDDLLYILARDWQGSGRLKGPVVGTLMSNFGLERSLRAMGIGFQRARVGDRYVHQMLRKHGGVLGGETSGHLLCLDRASTGDGIVSALQVLDAMTQSGASLAELRQGLDKVPQITRNVTSTRSREAVASAAVQGELRAVEKALGDGGRVVLRPSGTEPLVRVTVETDDADLAAALADRLVEAVRSAA